MKLAAIYARVSTPSQQHTDTIASQVAALQAYAQAHDYHVSPQHLFQDAGYSGASLARPALDRLRDTVAAGELEAVLILAPDRLARQFAYQYVVTEEFEQAGCEVVFLSHDFDDTPAARMLREMTGVFAEYERAQIAERCRRGRLFWARQGHIWMTEAPYGYTYRPRTKTSLGTLVINEAEAEVVRQIFRWLVDDQLSTYQLTKRLNASGLRTRHGKTHWSSGYLRKLLHNAVYNGTYYYNRHQQVPARRRNMPALGTNKPHPMGRTLRPKAEWIAVSVPALIDSETWALAQQQLTLNAERAPRNNKKRHYLLRGLLVCGYCQVRLIGHTGGTRGQYRRYLCARKESLRGYPHPCPGRTMAADMVEDVVWQSVSALLQNPPLLLEQYHLRQDPDYGTPEQQEQHRLERRGKALAREDQRLLDAYQISVIELEELQARRDQMAEERGRIETRLTALKEQQKQQTQQAALTTTVEEFCRHIQAALQQPSFETQQKILRLMVQKIVVTDEQITIHHMIPLPDVRLQRRQRFARNWAIWRDAT